MQIGPKPLLHEGIELEVGTRLILVIEHVGQVGPMQLAQGGDPEGGRGILVATREATERDRALRRATNPSLLFPRPMENTHVTRPVFLDS
jgi:hypothetical protein